MEPPTESDTKDTYRNNGKNPMGSLFSFVEFRRQNLIAKVNHLPQNNAGVVRFENFRKSQHCLFGIRISTSFQWL